MSSAISGEMNRDPQGGVSIRIRGVYPSLKTALQKVAKLILSKPEMVIYATVNEVAAAAQVSEATVMRFCRILDFKGFQDFKIALARELFAPSPGKPDAVAASDVPAALVRQVYRANIAVLEETLEVLDLKQLEQAAQDLLNCRRLAVIGVSGSGLVVPYADLLFNSIGLSARGYTERYQILTAAALLTVADVLLAISPGGDSQEILDAARVAKDNGARVIAITSNSLSPLSRMADLVLLTAARDMTRPRNGLPSFLCEISVIDSLFALLQLARPNESRENLAKIEKVLQRPT
jgi:RpiR family carbohydrate utilization transcriptional regulator